MTTAHTSARVERCECGHPACDHEWDSNPYQFPQSACQPCGWCDCRDLQTVTPKEHTR